MLSLLFNDKALKPKEKTEQLSKMVLDKTISTADLIKFADAAKDPVKATCIESIEFATQAMPEVVGTKELDWIIAQLTAKAPRIKWEAAKVIANTIARHPRKVETAVRELLANTGSDGTVVRWSAATALAQILKMKTSINTELIPAINTIIANEEKNSIKKIYQDALKKIM